MGSSGTPPGANRGAEKAAGREREEENEGRGRLVSEEKRPGWSTGMLICPGALPGPDVTRRYRMSELASHKESEEQCRAEAKLAPRGPFVED